MKELIKRVLSIFTLISLIFTINIGTVFFILEKIDYLQYSKLLYYFGILSILIYIFNKILKQEKFKTKDILIILLTIFGYISYCFAYNQESALYGINNRNEGLFILLTYYSVYLLSTTLSNKDKKIVMFFLILNGLIEVFIGTIQTLRINEIFGYDRTNNWSTNFRFASGTQGNPNFYSIYILLCLSYCYGCLLNSKDKIKKVIYLLLTIIFGYGLIIGNTISCYLAFFIIFIYTVIKIVNKNNYKKILLGFIIGITVIGLTLSIVDKFINRKIYWTTKKNINEISDIFKNGINDQTGNGRILIWKKTLSYTNKYFLTGIGIDNFKYLDNGGYLCGEIENNYQCFDKAHNEYLQIFITEGMFTIIIYLTFISYVIYNNRKNNKEIDIYLLPVIAYLIQAFFNISVITVAPIFYMMMGFSYKENKKIPLTSEVIDNEK